MSETGSASVLMPVWKILANFAYISLSGKIGTRGREEFAHRLLRHQDILGHFFVGPSESEG
jgi:hypothetical protein